MSRSKNDVTIFASRYAPPPSPSISFQEPSMTQQHFKDECDINSIIRRFNITGELPQTVAGVYGDVSEMPSDLAGAHEYFRENERLFMELPSNVRESFGNNPLALLEYVNSPAYAKALENERLKNSDLMKDSLSTMNGSQNTAQAPVNAGQEVISSGNNSSQS